MADDEDRWRSDQDWRRGREDDRGRWGERDRLGSGRKPGQEHDYGRTMLDDMRRYARGDYGRGDYGREDRAGRSHGHDEGRDWWDRAGDEVSSWLGDEDAGRRRVMDDRRGSHRGRGPRGYTRSDERIRDDVNDRLTDDPYVDASDIEVAVSGREVTLTGTVDSRLARRRAEDIAESISGVTHVQNNLRVRQPTGTAAGAQGMADIGGAPAAPQAAYTDATTRR
jgi:osmotically-inducible protein OsmY